MEAARGCLSLDMEWTRSPLCAVLRSSALQALGLCQGGPAPCLPLPAGWPRAEKDRRRRRPARPRPQPSFFQCHSCIFWSFVWFPNLSRRRPLN